MWVKGGGDSFSLQRLLGHTSGRMTERYVNLLTDDLAEKHRSNSPMDRMGVLAEKERRLRKLNT